MVRTCVASAPSNVCFCGGRSQWTPDLVVESCSRSFEEPVDTRLQGVSAFLRILSSFSC